MERLTASFIDSFHLESETSCLLENSLPQKGKSVQTKLQIDNSFGLKILNALDGKRPYRGGSEIL